MKIVEVKSPVRREYDSVVIYPFVGEDETPYRHDASIEVRDGDIGLNIACDALYTVEKARQLYAALGEAIRLASEVPAPDGGQP